MASSNYRGEPEDEVKVLLVEDDDGIAMPLAAALGGGGYEVTRVATGREALALANDELAAVVLDLGLPDIDGVEICRRLHEAHPGVPVLMLTARTSEADVVVGLDAGADDYVTKPFRLAELLARLRALIRRAQAGQTGQEEEAHEAQDVRVDLSARRAWRGEEELDLTPKEFDLLAMLVRQAGHVVTREDIMREVWDTTWFGSTKTVDMHVSWLRRKLGDDAAHPRYLSTVRGVGLRFETGE
ncbi:MAG TPA: response regulator transcription factor [Euzebya sp.]|nr:response regulator transcription factor [Euzebya sp.]